MVRYVDQLAVAFGKLGLSYLPSESPTTEAAHFHLANSSRSVVRYTAVRRSPYAITVHDVVPLMALLRPISRALIHPAATKRAGVVIVHSTYAADMLRSVVPGLRRPIEVIHFGTPQGPASSREAARRALGIEDGAPLVVLPGAIKPAKMIDEAVSAAAPLLRRGALRLALVGRIVHEASATHARELGAIVTGNASNETYDLMIAAADVVLVLRSHSVGETNMPLLEALGAGRAVVATSTGSIPEVAGGAALLAAAEPDSIRAALVAMLEDATRTDYERRAVERRKALTWEASAQLHAQIFDELWD